MKKYHKLNIKIGLFFLILVVVIAMVIGNAVYFLSFSNQTAQGESQMIRCANYLNGLIDADLIRTWLENGADDTYWMTKKSLEGARETFELSYVFVYCPVEDGKGGLKDEIICVFDLNPVGDHEDKLLVLGEHDHNVHIYEELAEVYRTGEEQTTGKLSTKHEGDLLTTMVPLRNDSGEICAITGVCARLNNIKNRAANFSLIMVIVIDVMIVLFAAAFLIYVTRRIIRPVKLLSKNMDGFVKNGFDVGNSYITDIRTRDEVEQMADNFNSMADAITRYTDDLKTMTASRERLRAELDVAGCIRSAVSAENTFSAFTERSDFELSSSLKNTVYNSCSFCNYFLTDETHLLIVLGESVGKSLPSMLMSMLASTNICALAKMGVEPYKIAGETNNSLCGFERNDISMTVSALIAQIDLTSGEMKYVNAGMPPVIVKRTGEPYVGEEEGMQFNLGEMYGVAFEQKTLHLNQGMSLFFTSYGVAELKNADGEAFSRSRLCSEINDIAAKNYPLEEMIAELERRLDAFRGSTPIELDTTILGFRYLS